MLKQLLIVVIFSVVVWEIQCIENVLIKRDNGKHCICKDQTCEDNISCVKHNTICLKRAIQVLQNQKDAKYNKALLAEYKQLITIRGNCLDNCEKRWADSDVSDCIEDAQNKFICKWTELLKDISKKNNKEQVASLVEDIRRTSAQCINKDCKPKCQGPNQCNPQFNEALTENCIKDVYGDLIKELKSDSIKTVLGDAKRNALRALDELKRCEKVSCPKTKKACKERVQKDATVDDKSLQDQLNEQVGSCSANSIRAIIQQGLALCNLNKKK